MIFKYENIKVEISSNVIELLKSYIQDDKKKLESGGIVTGSIYDNRIRISNCSTPTKFDEQSRYNFTRSKKSGQDFINGKFKQSNGTEIYLGEWHTHPEKDPTPSCTDRISFSKTLSQNELNSDIHFMIIVGTNTVYIGVYEKKRNRKSFNIML